MNVIEWVLQGDESLVYLVHKNLLKTNQEELQSLQSKLLDRGIANLILNKKDKKPTYGAMAFTRPNTLQLIIHFGNYVNWESI